MKIIEHPAITKLRETIDIIGLEVATGYTLADAIREGAGVTRKKECGWIDGSSACAIGGAYLAGRARGYVKR